MNTASLKFENPALNRFAAAIANELALAQVLIRRDGNGYELRHVEDRAVAQAALRTIAPDDTRALAQFTAAGEFRPLKAAPTLQRGWRMRVAGDAGLERVLNQLYPGAIADCHAAQTPRPPVTDYREFTARQSGMYRITTKLSDSQAAEVTAACCAPARCLKRRWWTVPGLAPDAPGAKSLIPCLEPCAVLLETARQAVREDQREKRAGLSLADPAEAG